MSDRPLYYDRTGAAISLTEWIAITAAKPDAKTVAMSEVHGYTVQTVWTGLDHNWWVDGPPLIFDTTVTPRSPQTDGLLQRYATDEEALAGHADVCLLVLRLRSAGPGPAHCTCGHTREAHTHYRVGTDCCVTGCGCDSYQPGVRLRPRPRLQVVGDDST